MTAQTSEQGDERVLCCIIPDRTELQERTLMTDRTIVVGDRSRIDYGLHGADVMISEFCTINGAITANGDVHIGNWTEVNGDLSATEHAFLGEGVKVHGRLSVNGDLEIGDKVQIEHGFEAKGMITIRNPLPVIVYFLMYLMAVLRIDRGEDADTVFADLFSDDMDENPLVIPSGAVLDMEYFSVPDTMQIGEACRLHGNIRAHSVTVGQETTVFGSLRAAGGIVLHEGATIHGLVSSEGPVEVYPGAHVLGNIVAGDLTIHEGARIDGTMSAADGLRMVPHPVLIEEEPEEEPVDEPVEGPEEGSDGIPGEQSGPEPVEYTAGAADEQVKE
ncbi:polymer-forming cytoskeletal protein [Methanosphaerula subterraneus]|uniref:polymer-forming cytoskeletal protein n=1 Tax=Methanosphaerula subterraneus TaxID=3350244 RepID=UPI003F8600BF